MRYPAFTPITTARAMVLASLLPAVVFAEPPLPGPVPPSPAEPAVLPQAAALVSASQHVPETLPQEVTLAEVLAYALAHNTQTRTTWLAARAAAADLGRKRSSLYPAVDASVAVARQSQWALGGRFGFQQTTYGPALSVSYLLLDFGGRSAKIEEAFQGLIAADFAHNAALQEVVYRVQQAYFSYLGAQALRDAADASLGEARTFLEAAEARKAVGLATALDVLQARTAVAQAELARASLEGQVETVRGALATAMGLPATVPLNVRAVLPEIRELAAAESVEKLVAQALAQRPEVQQARARELAAQAKVKEMRAEGLPSLVFSGSANRTYYIPETTKSHSDNWSLGVALRFPLFTGFDRTYAIRQAQEQAEQARAGREATEQQAILDVWTAYYQLQTAKSRLAAAAELLETARKTQEVAAGRYKEGVGSMLDLTQAQATLAQARAEEVRARADYLLALAGLARSTGTLELPVRESER
ncbi:MAG: TolC family protein [Thermoanaerobaculum sp.]